MRSLVGVLFLSTGGGCGSDASSSPSSPGPAPELDPALVVQFDAEIEPARKFFEVPGVAVALVKNGRIVLARGFGVRRLETGDPVTTDTVFRVGSVTKSFTSTLMATLVDDGRFEFSSKAVDVDPSFELPTAELTQSVTVLQLMGMGTGLAETDLNWWEMPTAADLLTSLRELPIAGPPGTYLYNNEVYASAAYVGLKAANHSEPLIAAYAREVRERILQPLGMNPAAVTDDPSSLSDDYASSYLLSLAGGVHLNDGVDFLPSSSDAPSAALATNVTSLAKFAIMQLHHGTSAEGTRVVSPDNLEITHRGQTPIVDPDAPLLHSYAAGWVVASDGGVPLLWHNGKIDGFYTVVRLVPSADLGLIILTNGSGGAGFASYLEEVMMRLFYGKSDVDPEAIKGSSQTGRANLETLAGLLAAEPPLDAAAIMPYLGGYEHGFHVELDMAAGRLWFSAPATHGVLLPAAGLFGAPGVLLVGTGRYLGTVCRFSGAPADPRLELLDPQTLEVTASLAMAP